MIERWKGDNHDKMKEKSMGQLVVKGGKRRQDGGKQQGTTWTNKEEGEKKKEENRGQEGKGVSFEP
jgi:hypothetical protein